MCNREPHRKPSTFLLTQLAAATFAFVVAIPASATVIPGGNIINQTWTPGGSPYSIQGDITVPTGASLTMQAGTQVQIAATDAQAAGLDPSKVEIHVRGTMTWQGTAGNHVQITPLGNWLGVYIDSGGSLIADPFTDLMGNLTLNSSATFSGSGVNVTGSIQLGGTYGGGLPTTAQSIGTVFTLFGNDGTDAVIGTFIGLAQGAQFLSGPNTLRISYHGGDGNDVTATVITNGTTASAPEPATFALLALGLVPLAVRNRRQR